MKKVGIVGLGQMGIGIATNILKAGFELAGFDLSAERREMLGKLNGTAVDTVGAVGQASDVVFIMVMNGQQVQSVILDRKFENTGSHIGTMYKDLGISMSMARENGCAMFTASAAYELFQSGISLYPEGDNWSIIKLLEQIAGVKVKG